MTLPNHKTHRPLFIKEYLAFKSFLKNGNSQKDLARAIGVPVSIVHGSMQAYGVPHSILIKVRAFMIREGFTRVSARYTPKNSNAQ